MVDTVINLGGFIFENMEIPSEINFGGEQSIKIHDLIGGSRIIDSMGGRETNIMWSGLMLGPDAMSRALQLDSMRVSGSPITLSVFNLSYQVVIQKFIFRTERYYQIKYDIELATIQNNNNATGLLGALGLTGSVLSDFSAANAISSLVGFPSISAAMGELGSQINAHPSLETASPQAIQSISTAAQNVSSAISAQISTLNQSLFG